MASAVGGLANSLGSVSVPQVMFNDEKREMDRVESQAEGSLEREEWAGPRTMLTTQPPSNLSTTFEDLLCAQSCPHKITHADAGHIHIYRTTNLQHSMQSTGNV